MILRRRPRPSAKDGVVCSLTGSLVSRSANTHAFCYQWCHSSAAARLSTWAIHLLLSEDVRIEIDRADGVRAQLLSPASMLLPCAFERTVELAIPLEVLHLETRQHVECTVTLTDGKDLLERYPSQGHFVLNLSREELESQAWPL